MRDGKRLHKELDRIFREAYSEVSFDVVEGKPATWEIKKMWLLRPPKMKLMLMLCSRWEDQNVLEEECWSPIQE